MVRRSSVVFAALLITASYAAASDWPQFRGPNGDGVSVEKGVATAWGAEKNIAWQVKIPGHGWSSPIISADKVFVTSAVQEQAPVDDEHRGMYRWEIQCLDLATGETLWTRVAKKGEPSIPKHGDNTYATETPATDGERVYAYFGMTGVFAYDFAGKLVWQRDLGSYKMAANFGTSSSPVIHDGKLFLQIDNEESSFLVALNAKTGEEAWRVSREEGSTWSSPLIWQNEVRVELITQGKRVRSYEPGSGALLWEMDVRGGRASASPTASGNVLYVGSEARRDGGGYLFAVKAGASGDITLAADATKSDEVLWVRENAAPPMASPLVYEGLVYALERQNGIVTAYDAQTGAEVYKSRLDGARAFWAAPWAQDGKVFCLDDTGTTHVLKTGREFEVLAQNSIPGRFWASAATARGTLLLRSEDQLYSIAR
jgi:outer membrane protein assembly factor BamB